ncbi:MAG: glutaredoxin family protein [Planctomycetota bacterium]
MVGLLYTRRGCRLCETAEEMLAAYGSEAALRCFDINRIDIDLDPRLQQLYGSRVPVFTIDGTVVMEGRFDEAELVRLLTNRASAPAGRGHR